MIPVAVGGTAELGGPWWWTALIVGALFLMSFFFSGTETALFSLQKVDRQALSRGSQTAKQVETFLGKRAALITSILIGNETANIALSATTAGIVHLLTPDKPWLNVVVLTPALVLISEITPKYLALRMNRSWSLLAIWPLTVFFHAIYPVRVLFAWLASRIAMAFGVDPGTAETGLEEDELLVLVDRSEEVDQSERDIIEAVFDFDDLTVERVMTPRPDMDAISISTPWPELLDFVRQTNHSRVPVYSKRPDDIVGVLLIKDLLRHRHRPPRSPRQLYSLLLSPTFVPASKSADDMLESFLARKFHMAFVVDEHGTLVGLVTLDDLLIELLGESDDTDELDVAQARPDHLSVKASIDIEDFHEETDIAVPEGDYHTLGGFVFHELGRLPEAGDVVRTDTHQFEVAEMDGRRITEIDIIPLPSARLEATG